MSGLMSGQIKLKLKNSNAIIQRFMKCYKIKPLTGGNGKLLFSIPAS